MADDYDIVVNGKPARDEIDKLVNKLKRLSEQSVKTGGVIDKDTRAAATGYAAMATSLERAQRARDGVGISGARKFEAVQKGRTAASGARLAEGLEVPRIEKATAEAELALLKAINEETRTKIALRQQGNADLLAQGQRTLVEERRQEVADRREALAEKRELAAIREKRTLEERAARAKEKEERELNRLQEREARQRAREAAEAQKALDREARDRAREAARQARLYNESGNPHADPSTRYALYDVASTATVAAVAIGGIAAASVIAAAQFETNFTRVERTAQLTGDSIGEVRSQLLDLTTSMPADFDAVTNIAALGAQMNIAENDLDSFTGTIVRFSTTTNVAVDQASQSFGRISNLLDVPATKFENLGSSIAYAGVKSVATETEILSMTEQISGAAAVYDFTAQSVVGLSSTFASLAIAPEAARGSVTRLFGDIEKATATGGPALDNYARILGVTAVQAKAMWEADPSRFFEKLIKGLSSSSSLLNDIESIGASDVRDVNLLQRLAENSDLLTRQLGDADQAFKDGTFLGDSYAKVVDDLASKWTILTNSVKAFAAGAGSSLFGVLGLLIDAGTKFLEILNLVPSQITGIILVAAALLAGFLLLVGGLAATMAAVEAMRFVLARLSKETGITGISIQSLRAQVMMLAKEMGILPSSVNKASGSISNLGRTAASVGGKGLGKAAGILGWIFAITGGLAAMDNQITLSEDKLSRLNNANASGSLDKEFGLAGASAKGFKDTLTTMFSDNFFENSQWTQFLGGFLDTLTFGLTDLTASWDQNKAQFAALGAQISETATTDIRAANDEFQKYVQMAGGGEGAVKSLLSAMGDYRAELVNNLTLQGKTATEQEILNLALGKSDALNAAAAAQMRNAGDEAAYAAGEAGNYADELSTLSDSIDTLFSKIDTESNFYDSINELYSGLAEGGLMFNSFSEAGRMNLENLQGSMLATAEYGKLLGLDVTESLIPMFVSLRQQGVDTTLLLQELASQPITYQVGLNIQGLISGVNSASGSLNTMNTAQVGLNGNMNLAADYSRRVYESTKKYGDEAEEAAEKVKTLSDYTGELGNVFGEALDIRFGSMKALDEVTGAWNSIRDSRDEALKNAADSWEALRDAELEAGDAMRDYIAAQNQMRADKGILEYQLSVAIRYGDVLRANAIRAEIAAKNNEIADQSKGISDQQKNVEDARRENEENQAKAREQLDRSLTGNSNAAVENRAEIIGMVESYSSYIQQLANSGLSTEELTAKTRELQEDFIRQATQLGYSREELSQYTVGFEDLTYVIQNLPRDITVNADTNPAMRAVEEFLAKVNESEAKPKITPQVPDFTPIGDNAGNQFISAFNRRLIGQDADMGLGMFRKQKQPQGYGKTPNGFYAQDMWSGFSQSFDNLYGFADGRGTGKFVGAGSGRSDSNLVRLSNMESVVNARASQHYGYDFIDDLNSLKYKPSTPQITVQGGGGPSGPMELSLESLRDLADILSSQITQVVLDGKNVATAINSINATNGRRGSE